MQFIRRERASVITAVHTVTVFVSDQDKALDFYSNVLGFEVRANEQMGPEARWIEVAPPGQTTTILLYRSTPEMPGQESYEFAQSRIGKNTGVLLYTDDLQQTYAELSAKGVHFPTPPEQQFWGWWAVLADQDGNTYGLGQMQA